MTHLVCVSVTLYVVLSWLSVCLPLYLYAPCIPLYNVSWLLYPPVGNLSPYLLLPYPFRPIIVPSCRSFATYLIAISPFLSLFLALPPLSLSLCPPPHCCLSSFTVPSGVMISRPCHTSYQSSPFIAISWVPRYSLHAFIHPFCDVATVWRLWSSTPSLPAHFPLDHALPVYTHLYCHVIEPNNICHLLSLSNISLLLYISNAHSFSHSSWLILCFCYTLSSLCHIVFAICLSVPVHYRPTYHDFSVPLSRRQ